MSKVIGVLMMIAGIALGSYIGIWLCFVGGILDIVQVINLVINKEALEGMLLAFGILKIVLASLCGWLSAFILLVPGFALINEK